jgi:hypothetical protein
MTLLRHTLETTQRHLKKPNEFVAIEKAAEKSETSTFEKIINKRVFTRFLKSTF